MLNQALDALSNNESIPKEIEPDGFSMKPKYLYSFTLQLANSYKQLQAVTLQLHYSYDMYQLDIFLEFTA